jgi:putative phage-type endonuclease
MTAPRQGTEEWLAARRSSVSSTDIGVLLGISPYRSEADLADEKLGRLERPGSTLPMRVGLALEPLIAAEYTRQTGLRLRRSHTLARHPRIEWAVASPDFYVVGRPWLMEAKWSTSSRWRDGLPQDVESQAMWQLGVTRRERCDVAALLGGRELQVFHVEYDDAVFDGLIDIALDFRARLQDGGPFSESLDSLKRRYPVDDGTEMIAGGLLLEAVTTLIDVRGRVRVLKEDEDRLEVLIKQTMGEASTLIGPGWRIQWKRTKDLEQTDWRLVAEGLLRTLPEAERDALVSLYTTVKEGYRPFRVFERGSND